MRQRMIRLLLLATFVLPLSAWGQAPAGTEFRVNTTTSSSQSESSVAADASGDFVVAWESAFQDGDGLGIFGQRFNAEGLPQGTEFQVNTFSAGDQTRPAVAFPAPGNFVVVWHSRDQDGSADGVFGQRFNALGAAQGPEFRVNTSTAGSQRNPSVAAAPLGGFVVVWESDGGVANHEILGQRFDASGTPQGSEFQVNTFTTEDQRYPSVSSDPSGNFVVVWQSAGQDGSGDGIFGQRFNSLGVAQGTEFPVNTFTAGGQRFPSLASDRSGDFFVVWDSEAQDGSGRGVFAQRFAATGIAQGSEFRIRAYIPGDQARPSIATDRSGNFFPTWEGVGGGDDSGVFGRLYDGSGLAVGTRFPINTHKPDTQAGVSVAATSHGGFVATWHSDLQDGSEWGVYGQRFSDLIFADGFEPGNAAPVATDDAFDVDEDGTLTGTSVLVNDTDGESDVLTAALVSDVSSGALIFNADGTFEYTPEPDFNGTDSFTYRAHDGTQESNTATVTLTVNPVNDAPAFTAGPDQVVAENAGAQTVSPWATGISAGPADESGQVLNFDVTGNTNPGLFAAGPLVSPTGDLTYTPATGVFGVATLTLVLMDDGGTASGGVDTSVAQSFTVTVTRAPTITSADNATFTVGTLGNFTVTTTGFPAPSIARGGVALPSGVTFVDNGNGTGTLSGTPGAGTGGTYAITFQATNAGGSSAVQSFTLTVNEAPTITSANVVTFTVGTLGSFTVTTTGVPTPSIARGGVALPAGVTFLDNGDGTGTLSGTPGAGTGGTYAITFQATNVAGSSPLQNFTLTVNEAPAITSAATATFAPGLAGQTFTVTTTGFPRNPGMVITQTGSLPTGVTFTDNNDGTATVAGTPAADTQSGSPYLWTITASNGIPPDAVQDPFTFNVTCPVITVSGTIPALTVNTAMSAATFTQTGGSGTIAWSATGLPAGLSIGPSNGQVTGTPTATGTFDVVVTATDAGACTGTRSITVTVAPVAVADIYNGGVDNTQYVITGGTTGTPGTPSVQNATRVVGNDLPTGGVTATAGTFATGQGGSVTIATDGTYLYTPPLRSGMAAITADTFSYTVQSNTGGGAAVTSAPATVTLNLVGRVWYVLNNGAAGNGQSQSPLQTLAAAQTASTANDHIFIYTGSGNTTNLNNGIVLKAGQRLIGQGVALVVNGNTLVAAGTNPQIGNSGGAAVTLADGNTVSGLTISNPSGFGITGANVNTLTVSAGVIIAGAGGGAFSLSGGNGAVDFGAAITNSANRAVSIVSRTGGSVTVSGAITAPGGTGILLNANSGSSSFTFSGGITLNGASSTFTATNSGTLVITGTNTIGATTPPTSTALTVTNTTIGASGITFERVSSSGGTNAGIVLVSTGSSGGLTVTGRDGVDADAFPDPGSGGTIANKSGGAIHTLSGSLAVPNGTTDGTGIYLRSTRGASFNGMQLNGFSNFAIFAIDSSNVSLGDSVVSGANGDDAALDEGAVSLYNHSGTGGIARCQIAGGFENNLMVLNTMAPANTLTVTGSTFGFNSTATGNNNILIEAQNAGTVLNFTLQSSTIKGARADFINASNNSSSTMSATIGGAAPALGNIFDNLGANAHPNPAAGGNRIVLGSVGSLTFDINNNVIRGARGEGIRVRSTAAGTTTGTANGHVRNNTVGVQGTPNSGSAEGSGIFLFGDGGSDMIAAVTNNDVFQHNNHGISMTFGDEINQGSSFSITITGNEVKSPGNINTDFNSISLNNGTVGATDDFTTCLNVGGATAGLRNDVTGGGSGVIFPNNADIRLRQRMGTTVQLPGYVGPARDNGDNEVAEVDAYLAGRNTLSTSAANSVSTGGGFVNSPGGASCTLPTAP